MDNIGKELEKEIENKRFLEDRFDTVNVIFYY